ncbi:MAG: hypothetical protein IID31_11725 [Planctomycetes bacterium]|nr:hypothetical protein [Planctomycetota bacterium]
MTDAENDSTIETSPRHNVQIENALLFYLVGSMLLIVSLVASGMGYDEQVANIPAALGALLLGLRMFTAAFAELRRGRMSSSTLAALAIAAALVSGEYQTAGWLAFILLAVDQIVRRTAWGAQRAIEDLVGLTPDVARIVDDQGERIWMISKERTDSPHKMDVTMAAILSWEARNDAVAAGDEAAPASVPVRFYSFAETED